MRTSNFVTAAAFLSLIGCANGEAPDSTGDVPPPARVSPCQGVGSDVLLCADFDDGSVSTMASVGFGGGTVDATAAHSVSAPFSLHVRTVAGPEAAAALLQSRGTFAAEKIQVDADVMIVGADEADTADTDSSSLLRLPIVSGDATIGAFFVHYVKASGELFLVAQTQASGAAGRVSLGLAPTGFFHLSAYVAPSGGGGAFAQVTLGDRSPKTVTIDADVGSSLRYALEAGLDVPAASPFEAFIDNVMVRSK